MRPSAGRDADFPPRVRATRGDRGAARLYDAGRRLRARPPLRRNHRRRADARRSSTSSVRSRRSTVSSSATAGRRPGRAASTRSRSSRATRRSASRSRRWSSRCARSARVTVKDRSDALVAAFAETLGEELPELRRTLDVRAWTRRRRRSGRTGARRKPTSSSRSAATRRLRAIRARCAPDTTFVPFGHRASAGYLARDALAGDADVAAGVARDALLYDGDGCLSLHLLFVEARARRRARALRRRRCADACAAQRDRIPARHRAIRRAPRASRAYAAAAAFRAANGTGACCARPTAPGRIVVEPPVDELPPFGGGVIPIISVDGLDAAAAYVARHRIPLQAVGVAGSDDATRSRRTARRGAHRARRHAARPAAGRTSRRPRRASPTSSAGSIARERTRIDPYRDPGTALARAERA